MKQLVFAWPQAVQKPLALSFQVPALALPDCSSGSRIIFPSGVKVILNFAPEGDAAVNGCPVKKVAFMSFGAILRFDEICDHWELIMFCAPAQGWQRKYHDLARSAQSRQ